MVVQVRLTNVNISALQVSWNEHEDESENINLTATCVFIDDCREFECPICRKVMYNPTQIENCGHIFCHECLNQWLKTSNHKTCPQCRNPNGDRQYIDQSTQRKISNLRVLCVNSERGCEAVVPLRDLEKHTHVCRHTLVLCPQKCSRTVFYTRGTIDQHLEQCSYRLLPCRLCNKEIAAYALKDHEDWCAKVPKTCPLCMEIIGAAEFDDHQERRCSHQLVNCQYQQFGCDEMVLRGSIPQHEKDFMPYHLSLVATKCSELMKPKPSSSSNSPAPSQNSGHTSRKRNTYGHTERDGYLHSHHSPVLTLEDQISRQQLGYSPTPPLIDDIEAQMKLTDEAIAAITIKVAEISKWRFDMKNLWMERLRAKDKVPQLQKDFDSFKENVKLKHDAMSNRITDTNKTVTRLCTKKQDFSQYCDDNSARVEQKAIDWVQTKIQHLSDKLTEDMSELWRSVRQGEFSVQQSGNAAGDDRLTSIEERLNSGYIFWKLECDQATADNLKRGGHHEMRSALFYSCPHGHKLQATAYLHAGDVDTSCADHITTQQACLDLSVRLVKGEYDKVQTWPYSGTITVKIIEEVHDIFLVEHTVKFHGIDHYLSSTLYKVRVWLDIKLVRNGDVTIFCKIENAMSRIPTEAWLQMVNETLYGRMSDAGDADLSELSDEQDDEWAVGSLHEDLREMDSDEMSITSLGDVIDDEENIRGEKLHTDETIEYMSHKEVRTEDVSRVEERTEDTLHMEERTEDLDILRKEERTGHKRQEERIRRELNDEERQKREETELDMSSKETSTEDGLVRNMTSLHISRKEERPEDILSKKETYEDIFDNDEAKGSVSSSVVQVNRDHGEASLPKANDNYDIVKNILDLRKDFNKLKSVFKFIKSEIDRINVLSEKLNGVSVSVTEVQASVAELGSNELKLRLGQQMMKEDISKVKAELKALKYEAILAMKAMQSTAAASTAAASTATGNAEDQSGQGNFSESSGNMHVTYTELGVSASRPVRKAYRDSGSDSDQKSNMGNCDYRLKPKNTEISQIQSSERPRGMSNPVSPHKSQRGNSPLASLLHAILPKTSSDSQLNLNYN